MSQQYDKIINKILSRKILPVIGYNTYDGFQVGVGVHNFLSPGKKITYYATPVYAFNSQRITGYGGVKYKFDRIDAGFSVAAFSTLKGTDSAGKKVFGDVYKAVPYLRYNFASTEQISKWIELKTFFIGERSFDYVFSEADSMYYPFPGKTATRYLNQLTLNVETYRKLFPYDFQLQLQQGESFYRINATLNYFFNYMNEGGVGMRLFAAKFGYIGPETAAKRFETFRYQPKLTAVRGNEDYTYSNYFVGRNEFDGFAAQQIMIRDGGLKLRTDMFQDLQGRSDNWVASMNLNTTLPNKLFPFKLPVRIFVDIGTYAGLWERDSPDPRFLYVAGLQLTLLKDLVNIYAPVVFSRKFRDNLKTVPEENKFLKRISFSIDIHRFNIRRFTDSKIIL
jgi:hypothetical protein